MTSHSWQRGGYTVSTDRSRLEIAVIHRFLRESYWAANIPRDIIVRSIEGSISYGIYHDADGEQVGFGRVITDGATFAYVADVFVIDPHRARGLGSWLIRCMLMTPELQGLRRWLLATRDAHEVYRRAGFEPVAKPSRFMEIFARNPYPSGA
jgi:GNAT superfamily N-acetyltransferase